MKKITLALLLLGALACAASAEAIPTSGLTQELSAALQDMSTAQLGTLTVADLEQIAGRISIAVQKIHYVRKVRNASFMFPGAGQFMTGDPVGGSLYLAGDLAVVAGTIVGAYFALPSDLHFSSSLNYFTSPYNQITAAWGSHSFVDYLPSVGVLAGGFIVKAVLGHFSAVDAARRARQNIDNGTVTFTPDFDFLDHGFGMGMKFRY
ncbi:MAG: hypothetical protein ABSG63_09985 [Spirochaetia bacterium]|jgi:hypothetical protein